MNVKLIAGAAMNWGGQRLRVGDRFEASEQDASDLIAVGHASKEEVAMAVRIQTPLPGTVTEAPEKVPSYSTKVIERPRKKKNRGNYKRRDMRADK